MYKDLNKRFMGLIAVCSMVAFSISALPLSHYASSSKLAHGKWVKISIPADGVYEITDAELLEMGFSNPANVLVYGNGGHAISEVLNGTAPDDIEQVSTARLNGKMCFYANGITAMTLTDPRNTPHYTREPNTYSTMGYYFLTEGDNSKNIEIVEPSAIQGTTNRSTSLGYYLHENDIFSAGYTGKCFLGETVTSDVAGTDFDMTLPGIANEAITVNPCVVAKVSQTSYIRCNVKCGDLSSVVPFTLSQCRINSPIDYEYYRQAAPVSNVTLPALSPDCKLNIRLDTQNGTSSMTRLDYFIVTYTKDNVIVKGYDNQTLMGVPQLSVNDRILLPGASASTVVWRVDNTNAPIAYELQATTDDEGKITGYEFSPNINTAASHFVAFDPEGTLKKISGYTVVENQNLHALPTPDMVIITNKYFMSEAQRIADLHKTVDGMDVTVVDQEEIFNEFSSGTPDGMAYRLMCKMFYDRDPNKFKYLLLFGPGSYDNRGLISNKPNRLLTYQSDRSDNQDYTYTSDDFFGLLDDNSGSQSSILRDMLRLGVGRFPVTSLDEAKSDVDKLIKYVTAQDYGVWRNNTLIISGSDKDVTHKDLHIFQAEGINNLIENSSLNTHLNTNKVYIDMFELNDDVALEARHRLQEYWQDGQYFTTYVGHAGPLVFTQKKLWTSPLVQSTIYPHLPIMTTACCEVARFDSDERGIAEHMFHAPQGGAIALLTSTRQVYSDQNDIMNNRFVENMFSYEQNGKMPTLGYAYMMCKQNFNYTVFGNKMSYVLLGDPAIKINYPKPLFDITSINDVATADSTAVSIHPLQTLTVTAQVKDAEGNVDTNFNGDATVTLYDVKRKFKTVTQVVDYSVTTTRDIYYPRDILAQVQGRVVNGVFTASIVVPRFTKGINENAAIRVYAHRDNSTDMVNGDFSNLTLDEFDEQIAVNDDTAPVINTMYLNEEQTFAHNNVVPANSTLFITASDDTGINTQSASVGNCMKLILDGGKQNYPLVKDNAVATDDGRTLNVAFPVDGLSEGIHTLTFTVFDVAGNTASHTISFIVASKQDAELATVTAPAVETATIDLVNCSLATTPSFNIKVVNAQGQLVWTNTTSAFPMTWDLKDSKGNRVQAGIYKVFGTFADGKNYGGTSVADIIVVDPVKNNK